MLPKIDVSPRSPGLALRTSLVRFRQRLSGERKTDTMQTLSAKSICLDDGQCVDVRDVFTYDGDEYRFHREIIVERIEISTMYLTMPKKINLKKIDTSSWNVDKGAHIFNRYTLTMI
ncbi:hypothetical protein Y032_1144g3683, partial [Ancylostoma ceylanicum]